MIKSILKNTPITAILIIYLFVCGLVYLIGFWSTFNIDVFSLISIYDIPKNFAFPFFLTQGLFLMNLITGTINVFDDDRDDINYLITIDKNWSSLKRYFLGIVTNTNLLVFFTISSLNLFFQNHLYNEMYWAIIYIVLSLFLLHRVSNIKVFRNKITNIILRTYLTHLIILFPLNSFFQGKYQSLKIYHNKEIKYSKVTTTLPSRGKSDANTLKLLGFISDNYLFSSLDNKEIYLYNKSEILELKLKQK